MKKSFFASFCAVLAVSFPAMADGFKVAGCTVVIPDSCPWWTSSSACDLTNALFRVTGKPSALYREKALPAGVTRAIYVGDTKAAALAGIDTSAMKLGDALIRISPDKVFIAGRRGEGPSGGVIEFLQRYADCWYTTVDGVDPFPENPGLTVPTGEYRYRPFYGYRHFVGGGMFPATRDTILLKDYSRRLRAPEVTLSRKGYSLEDRSLRPTSVTGHSYYFELWPKDHFKDHPEWYSMDRRGKRNAVRNNGGQLCLSNRELLEVMTTNMLARMHKEIEKYGPAATRIFDFTQNDCTGYLCCCPECSRIIAKYNRVPGGNAEGGDAGLQLEFVNELARRLRAEIPGGKIRTFAYVSTETPPVGIKPEPNVIIWLCDLYSQSCHYLPLTHPFNRPRLDIFKEWASMSSEMEIWDYWLDKSTAADYPDLHVDSIAADLKLFADHGVRRFFMESGFKRQCFYELHTFVSAQCFVHPDSDVDRLVRVHCRVYGAAAEEMYAAFSWMRRLLAANPPASAADWHMRVLPWRTLENWQEFRSLCEKAYAKADTSAARCRIADILAAVSKEIMTKTKGRSDFAAEFRRAKDEYLRYSETALAGIPLAPKDRETEKATVRDFAELADLSFKDLPVELADVSADDLLCFEYRSFYCKLGWCKVEDPASERGVAYRRVAAPADGSKPPFYCLLRDKSGSMRYGFNLRPVADGKYRWYRIGRGKIGQGARFFIAPDNYFSIWLTNQYIPCDGMEKDLNTYDIWVSAKYGGEPDDDPSTGLFVDRVLFRRVEGSGL